MDFATAWGAWRRRERTQPIEPGEPAFVAAARARPDLWSVVERAEGRPHPPEEAQNALLVLAAQAAATQLEDDARLSSVFERTRVALESEGAKGQEIYGLVGALLLEEAFGDESPADGFDWAFVAESLETLRELTMLSPERVAALESAFASGTTGAEQRSRRLACQALFGAAWAEGPDLITCEHLQEAAARLQPAELSTLSELVDHLAQVKLVGPRRLERLRRGLEDLGEVEPT